MGSEVKTTTCYLSACRCGIRVHLKGGEVRYLDGNLVHPRSTRGDLRQAVERHH
jgi:sulfite dehydrogenase (quinone) subunit SoeA